MMDRSTKSSSPHWLECLGATHGFAQHKRRAWKVLREGEAIEAHLREEMWTRSWTPVQSVGSLDSGAVKYRLRSNRFLDECEAVVLFPKVGKRATVCVSSQIGCGVGCLFCATGTMGFQRNLSVEEILEQVYLARVFAHEQGRHLRNVVFMGMGEPLHNFQAVSESISLMVSDRGFGFRERFITVSTSGIPSAMLELVRRFPSIRLALSLHTAEATDRRRLMPKAPNDLGTLKRTLQEIHLLQNGSPKHTGAPATKDIPVWIEYVLIDGWNDTTHDAERLLTFCEGLCVEVNLIPLNGTLSSERMSLVASSKESQQRFAETLRRGGVKTTIRNSFGSGDNAACGQLVNY
jgi:23S rRNA (adenine2503-C2)-methyltransferase